MRWTRLLLVSLVLMLPQAPQCQETNLLEVEEKLDELITKVEDSFPDDSSDKEVAFREAARVYRQIGKLEKAIRLYEKILSIQRGRDAPQFRELIQTLSDLAIVYAASGDYRTALGHVREYGALLRKHQPDNVEAIFSATNNEASMLMGMENYAEAEQAYLKNLAYAAKTSKASPESVASIHHNLVALYLITEAYEKSEESLITALQQKEQIFGNEHKEVGLTLSVLAKLYLDTDRPEESREARERAVRLLGFDPLEG